MKRWIGCFLVLFVFFATSCEKENGPVKDQLKDRVSRAVDSFVAKSTFYLPYETASVRTVNTYFFNESTKSFEDVSELQYALTKGMIGDDGIVTTADDLGKFYKKLFETTDLISEKSREEMLQFVSDGRRPQYGLGIMYRGGNKTGDAWGHSGAGHLFFYKYPTI